MTDKEDWDRATTRVWGKSWNPQLSSDVRFHIVNYLGTRVSRQVSDSVYVQVHSYIQTINKAKAITESADKLNINKVAIQ